MIDKEALDELIQLPDQPFRRTDAIRAGVPHRHLDTLIQEGLLSQPVRGVLLKGSTPDDLRSRAAVARLVLPAGAAICRGSAAWLLGIDARAPGEHTREPALECAVPLGTTPLRRAGIHCYVTDLVDDDVVDVAGLPCVSPARTAIDLARWSLPGVGLGTLDAMTRDGLVDPAELLVQVERWRGDRFVARARRLIGLCDPRAESQGESWMRLRFHDAGFPPPEPQISLTDEWGVEIRRLDLGYRKRRYGWEYDGEEFHTGLAAEAADRRRREEIERRWGWTVVGVGKNLVLGRSMALEYAIAEIVGMEPAIRRRAW